MLQDDLDNQAQLSGHDQQLLDGILDEGTLSSKHGWDQKVVDYLLEQASWNNPKLVKYMKRGVAYHHGELNSKGRVAVEALFRIRYIQIVFSTSTLGKKNK
jgi:replicative superfamily II helicase